MLFVCGTIGEGTWVKLIRRGEDWYDRGSLTEFVITDIDQENREFTIEHTYDELDEDDDVVCTYPFTAFVSCFETADEIEIERNYY